MVAIHSSLEHRGWADRLRDIHDATVAVLSSLSPRASTTRGRATFAGVGQRGRPASGWAPRVVQPAVRSGRPVDRPVAVAAPPTAGGAAPVAPPAPFGSTRPDLFALISHELRRPLAVLRASSEIALDESVTPEEQRKLLDAIFRNTVYLDQLAHDLLEAFKLDHESSQLACADVDLVAVCDAAVADIQPTAPLPITVIDRRTSGAHALAHQSSVRLVIANLIQNAIKYAPTSSTVRLIVEDARDGLTVTVEDSGPGIPAEHAPRIFEPFFRFTRSGSTVGGYGLGLYIVRRLMELQGGSVRYQDAPVQGSRFVLTFTPAERTRDFSHASERARAACAV